MHLESLGLDLTYWTDVDLHARPQLLANHRCLFSLGHDEYWSRPMRQAAAQAVANGVNLAFLGANAVYRQIRMEPSSIGPNRLEVCYKSAAEDPLATQQPSLTTVNWAEAPVHDPESTLIGSMYQSVGAKADMVVTDASSWFYDGCNLTDGHTFPNMILGEYDRYVPSLPGPRNVDVLAHSPVPGQSNWSDITYYTAPGNGGGVLAAGSASFVSMISTTGAIPSLVIPGPFPGITDVMRRAMENVYGRFGVGPASSYGASSGNWTEVYTRGRRQGGDRGWHPRGLTAPRRAQRARNRACHHFRPPPPYDRPAEMGNIRRTPLPGAPTARLGHAGRRRARRPPVERLLLVPGAPRRRAEAQADDHDLVDGAAAALPAHRAAGPGRRGPPAARHRGQDRQLPRRPAAVGAGQGRHRVRGAGRGRHHPLRRGVPVPGRVADRPGPLGPQHRHRHPRAAGQPARGARGRHQPGAGQHQRLPDRQRRPGRQRLAPGPPARPGAPRRRLHLDRHRLRHAPHHDHAAGSPCSPTRRRHRPAAARSRSCTSPSRAPPTSSGSGTPRPTRSCASTTS